MARSLRLEFPGAIWHITSRGNQRHDIFLDEEDRRSFLARLGSNVTMYRWRLHAWVLMSNHYHLLVETPEPNLARGMQQFNGWYAQAFNRRHGRVGHVVQGRYKGILVERESHLLELARYLALNPVRAGVVRHAEEYGWSSYRETAGLRKPSAWLETGWILSQFGRDRESATLRFRRFVAQGRDQRYCPWVGLVGQIYLGGDGFQRKIDTLLEAKDPVAEVPRCQQALFPRPKLDQVLAAVAQTFETTPETIRSKTRGKARKAFALLARRLSAAPLGEVADVLGVTSWSASHAATKAGLLEGKESEFRSRLQMAGRVLRKVAKYQL